MSVIGEYQVCEGHVERVRNERLVVALTPPDEQGAECIKCGMCTNVPKGRTVRVLVERSHPIDPGQAVKIRRFMVNPAIASLLAFGLPLACMLLAAIASTTAAHLPADSPAVVAASVAGLAVGFFIAHLADRALSRRHPSTVESLLP